MSETPRTSKEEAKNQSSQDDHKIAVKKQLDKLFEHWDDEPIVIDWFLPETLTRKIVQ